jgi:hypothetical protein
MEWAFVKALLWGLLVFLQFHGHTPACLQEERIALLKLKLFLERNTIYADDTFFRHGLTTQRVIVVVGSRSRATPPPLT